MIRLQNVSNQRKYPMLDLLPDIGPPLSVIILGFSNCGDYLISIIRRNDIEIRFHNFLVLNDRIRLITAEYSLVFPSINEFTQLELLSLKYRYYNIIATFFYDSSQCRGTMIIHQKKSQALKGYFSKVISSYICAYSDETFLVCACQIHTISFFFFGRMRASFAIRGTLAFWTSVTFLPINAFNNEIGIDLDSFTGSEYSNMDICSVIQHLVCSGNNISLKNYYFRVLGPTENTGFLLVALSVHLSQDTTRQKDITVMYVLLVNPWSQEVGVMLTCDLTAYSAKKVDISNSNQWFEKLSNRYCDDFVEIHPILKYHRDQIDRKMVSGTTSVDLISHPYLPLAISAM